MDRSVLFIQIRQDFKRLIMRYIMHDYDKKKKIDFYNNESKMLKNDSMKQ